MGRGLGLGMNMVVLGRLEVIFGVVVVEVRKGERERGRRKRPNRESGRVTAERQKSGARYCSPASGHPCDRQPRVSCEIVAVERVSK